MTKASASTKADLLEMLAEAVRNTQPQPVNTPPETIRNTQSQPVRNEQPERKRNTEANHTALCGNHQEPALRHAGGGGQEYGLIPTS